MMSRHSNNQMESFLDHISKMCSFYVVGVDKRDKDLIIQSGKEMEQIADLFHSMNADIPNQSR